MPFANAFIAKVGSFEKQIESIGNGWKWDEIAYGYFERCKPFIGRDVAKLNSFNLFLFNYLELATCNVQFTAFQAPWT